jgi:MFS family permease
MNRGAALPSEAARRASLRRVALATFAGTAMEWYDYYLFGLAASLVFNRLYFTELNAAAAALAAFATFGVGFVARPFGAALFGWIGDRIGRKPALIVTVTLIGLATGLIGLLPDFSAIGVAAPVLLVLLRLTQGIAVGGEWSGAVTLAFEHAPPDRRGWYASLPQLGSPVGALLSSGAFALVLNLGTTQFDEWAWRLPFLAAFPLLGVAFYLRRSMGESPEFQGSREEARGVVPAIEIVTQAPARLLLAMGTALIGIGGYYMFTTFAIGYGVRVLKIAETTMVNSTLLASVAELIVIACVGRVVDRVRPWRVTFYGSLLCAAIAWPAFLMIESGQTSLVLFAVAAGVCTVSAIYAASGALLSELFPARLRYSGVALAYNLAGVIAGLLPFVATALLGATGNHVSAPAGIVVSVAIVSAFAAWRVASSTALREPSAIAIG